MFSKKNIVYVNTVVLCLFAYLVSLWQISIKDSSLMQYGSDFAFVTVGFVLNFLSTLPLMIIFSAIPWVFYITFPITSVVYVFATYAVFVLGMPISTDSISLVFETNTGQATEFLRYGSVLAWCVAALVYAVVISYLYFRRSSNAYFPARTTSLWVLVMAVIIVIQPMFSSFYKNYYAQHNLFHSVILRDTLLSSGTYVHKRYQVSRILASITSASDLYDFTRENEEPVTVVLVIGEAARADHFQLNGYHRPTNPRLSKVSNLVNFTNVESCAGYSGKSVPCMLTRGETGKFSLPIREKTFLSVFNAIGFKSWWLSASSRYDKSATSIGAVADEAQIANFLAVKGLGAGYNDDAILLPALADVVENHPDNSHVIVLHTIGSHWEYDKRVPEAFRHFKPLCGSRCSNDKLINSYDNTIVYADYIVSQAIETLQDKNAILVYTSDHGEFLGEDGKYLHGNFDRKYHEELYHPAMVWWVSDKYKETYPRVYERLLARADEKLTHDVIFYSVLGCAGVASEILKTANNLCYIPDVDTNHEIVMPR